MNQNKPQKSIISTGTTSVVLIFVMLCLLTFSVLSLTSAQANLRLSRRSAQRTTDYYDAENAANDILIQIDQAVEDQSAGDERAFYANLRSELETLDGVAFTDERHLAYQVPLGEAQVLAVELALVYDGPGGHYEITSWQAASEYDWTPDDTLNLMSAGNMPTG